MLNDITARKNQFYKLNNKLNFFSNEQIISLIGKPEGEPHRGKTLSITLDSKQIFIKRIPLTKLDLNNTFATRNLFNLPLYFNYNIGTIGINLYREIVSHIRTTNWVLNGTMENFPLMYHHRIIPLSENKRLETDLDDYKNLEEYQNYLEYWGNNENVGHYVTSRVAAKHEMLIFLEHIPFTLEDWIHDNIGQLATILDKMKTIIDFIRTKGMVHLDVHFGNIMISGETLYLTDFGLVLDENFDLDEKEHEFMASHSYFDYGEYITSILHPMAEVYKSLKMEQKQNIFQRYGIDKQTSHRDVILTLLKNLEEASNETMLNLDSSYVTLMLKYRDVITFMESFFYELENKKSKDTYFDNTKLQYLLQESGVV